MRRRAAPCPVRDAGSPGNTCGSVPDHALPRAAARCGARHRGGGNLRGDSWREMRRCPGPARSRGRENDCIRSRRSRCRRHFVGLRFATKRQVHDAAETYSHVVRADRSGPRTERYGAFSSAPPLYTFSLRLSRGQGGRQLPLLRVPPRVGSRGAFEASEKVFYEASCRTKEPRSAGVNS